MHSHVTCMMWSLSFCRSKFSDAKNMALESATHAASRTSTSGSSLRIPEKIAVNMAFTSVSVRCSGVTSSQMNPKASRVACRNPGRAFVSATLACNPLTKSGHCLCGISAPAIFDTACAPVCLISKRAHATLRDVTQSAD